MFTKYIKINYTQKKQNKPLRKIVIKRLVLCRLIKVSKVMNRDFKLFKLVIQHYFQPMFQFDLSLYLSQSSNQLYNDFLFFCICIPRSLICPFRQFSEQCIVNCYAFARYKHSFEIPKIYQQMKIYYVLICDWLWFFTEAYRQLIVSNRR